MPNNHPSTYTVPGLPRALFGETYVIISVWKPSDMVWKAEYNILIKAPNEYLISDTVEFDVTDYPAELPPIDNAAMQTEAVQQAERVLTLELDRRANDAKRPDLAYHPVILEQKTISLVMLHKRNIFPVKFGDMATTTISPDLRRYLALVLGQERLRPNY
jgi:hypothetical protein